MNVPLACSVRGCALPLTRHAHRWFCPAGHSYDSARSGYVNLLQPQDRRSQTPGDTKASVEARARLIAAGVGRHLNDAIVEYVGSRPQLDGAVVDLGSGTGDALAALRARRSGAAVGIDLAVSAIELAAKRFPEVTWVVANADRRLPLLDHSCAVVMSLHGRRNPEECARVLIPSGVLIAAVPAPDDLAELRELIQGQPLARDRTAPLIASHSHFEIVERFDVRTTIDLGPDDLRDLLKSTYRGERHSETARVEALEAQRITFASNVVVFSTPA